MASRFFLGSKQNTALQLGVSAGVFMYPTVLGKITSDDGGITHKIEYYPYKSATYYTFKQFLKLGFRQNSRISFAVKAEAAGDNFASASFIASRTAKNKDEYYTGLKLFNRFIKEPEKKLFSKGTGQYFFLGVRRQLQQRNILDVFTYRHIYYEIGLVNNLWYNSNPCFCLAIGFSN